MRKHLSKFCAQWGCQNPPMAFGLCNTHYNRRKRPGEKRCTDDEYEHEFPREQLGALLDLFHALKSEAKRRPRPVDFALCFDDIVALTQRQCWYCGQGPTNTHKKILKRYLKSESARYYYEVKWNGLDRVDSSRGYTIDNVVTCCATCNRAKSDMTLREYQEWLEWVRQSTAVS